MAQPPRQRAGWLQFGWKVLLALTILVLMFIGSPITWALQWTLFNPVGTTLLLWGGLVVLLAGNRLFSGEVAIRRAWCALSVGAYVALTVPGLVQSSGIQLPETLGPVAALTLIAHLGRRDLKEALRDWALVMSIALYVSLGVSALWLLATALGAATFIAIALLPPLLFEGVMLLLRRVWPATGRVTTAAGLVISGALAVTVLSYTGFHPTTSLFWSGFFGLLGAVPIWLGLLLSVLTKPLVEVASGAHKGIRNGPNLGTALVELSHGPLLIALVVYVPLRLLR